MNATAFIRGAIRGVLVVVVAAIVIVALAGVFAVAVGYRPVVVLTGSMGESVPPGSMAVAGPVADVAPGDILVMRGDGRATVTHRVVDVAVDDGGELVAVTRGDANPDIDPLTYQLGERELTVRWVVPHAGRILTALRTPAIGLTVVGTLVLAGVVWALRRIWGLGRGAAVGSEGSVRDQSAAHRRRLQRAPAGGAALGALLAVGGVVLSLYAGVAAIGANDFATRECYDARLGRVQSGRVTSIVDGPTTVGITTVDPDRSFLLFSAASASAEADETMVSGRLASPDSIEFVRSTDGPPSSTVDIEWSLVEYACGVSVQRGTVIGGGSDKIDVAIQPVLAEASFVTASTTAAAGSEAFGSGDLARVELVNGDTVRLSGADALRPGSEHAWQVVTFDNGTDAFTQVVAASFTAGSATVEIELPTPVDTVATFLVASVSSVNSGPAVGDRLVRARLVDASTVEVTRQATTGSVEVSVQVVELRDGSTVQHGVLDLATGQAAATATIPPVTVLRSTAFSTVQHPAGHSGGSTTADAGGVVGAASVRVRLVDPTSVEVARDSVAAPASFAWQVVTWGGPSWADLSSPFRQRIDVTAGAVATPTGYTTSLTLDHATMVTDGLSLATGDDLRVWRHDGVTWAELDRVLDDESSWNDSRTTVWFRTKESIAAASTVSYWMYFGNQTPLAPLDDPSNVWLLTEGFDDGSLGVFQDRTGGADWYRAEPWSRRITLSIDPSHVSSPLTDEAVLVRLVEDDFAEHARPDGADFRFTAADGVTRLVHDIEDYDHSSGALTAWVRVPALSSATPTVIHLHYGAGDAPRQEDPRATWTDELAVWHLAADPAGPAPTLDDSGPHQHDGIALADTSATLTPSGPGVSLDGTLDRLESSPLLLGRSQLSASVAFQAVDPTVDSVLLAHGAPLVDGTFELGLVDSGGPTLRARLRVGGALVEATGGSVVIGGWHHAVATWDGGQLRLFLDGVMVASTPGTGTIVAVTATPVVIGAAPTGARAFAGTLADARLDDVAWTPARVAFRSANLLDPAVVTAGAPTVGSWFDQGGWGARRPLVIDADKVAGPLVDFPVFVQLTQPEVAAASRPDGADLVFTAADGTTRLDHHVESWDPATGQLAAWVRVPSLGDTADTVVYLYYANPSAVDQQDAVGVWGADADLVVLG